MRQFAISALSVILFAVPAVAADKNTSIEKLAEEWLQYMTGEWQVTRTESFRPIDKKELSGILSGKGNTIEGRREGKAHSWKCRAKRYGKTLVFLPPEQSDDNHRVFVLYCDPDKRCVVEYGLTLNQWDEIKSGEISPQTLQELRDKHSATKGTVTTCGVFWIRYQVAPESLHYGFGQHGLLNGTGTARTIKKTEEGFVKRMDSIFMVNGWFLTKHSYLRVPRDSHKSPSTDR